MFKISLLFIGIGLVSLGLANIILCLNLLVLGYSFWNFLIFIFTHFYTLLFFIGLLMIYIAKKRW